MSANVFDESASVFDQVEKELDGKVNKRNER